MQVDEANQAGITATPSLKVVDNQTGQSIILSGLAANEELLSAIDWLLTQEQ